MPDIAIGIVGAGFMARVHALAFAMADRMWDLPLSPKVIAYCGGRSSAVETYRWPELAGATRASDLDVLLEDSRIELCCICSSNDAHADTAIQALKAGKHVLCEKPLAHRLDDSRRMLEESARAAVQACVSFNYRRVPGIELARRMIAAGEIGEPRHFSGAYLQDWGLRPFASPGWREDPRRAGAGALADVGSHLIDLAEHLMGSQISSVMAATESEAALGEVLEGCSLLVAFAGGATGTLQVSRRAAGNRNGLCLEIRGSEGALAFHLERLNELRVSRASSAGETWRTLYVTESEHPWQDGRWPAGHPISWEHTFAYQAKDLLTAIASRQAFSPGFADGFRVDAVISAALSSMETGARALVEGRSP